MKSADFRAEFGDVLDLDAAIGGSEAMEDVTRMTGLVDADQTYRGSISRPHQISRGDSLGLKLCVQTFPQHISGDAGKQA